SIRSPAARFAAAPVSSAEPCRTSAMKALDMLYSSFDRVFVTVFRLRDHACRSGVKESPGQANRRVVAQCLDRPRGFAPEGNEPGCNEPGSNEAGGSIKRHRLTVTAGPMRGLRFIARVAIAHLDRHNPV